MELQPINPSRPPAGAVLNPLAPASGTLLARRMSEVNKTNENANEQKEQQVNDETEAVPVEEALDPAALKLKKRLEEEAAEKELMLKYEEQDLELSDEERAKLEESRALEAILNRHKPRRSVENLRKVKRGVLEKGVPITFALNFLRVKVEADVLTSELVVYIPFLIMFVFFFMSTRAVGDSFYITENIRQLFVYPNYKDYTYSKAFADIAVSSDWTSWFTSILLPVVYQWDLDSFGFRYLPPGNGLLIGGMRLRSIRNRNNSCVVNSHIYPPTDNIVSRICYGEYTEKSENNLYCCPHSETGIQLNWTDPLIAKGTTVVGPVLDITYHAGGFIVPFPFNLSLADAQSLYDNYKSDFVQDVGDIRLTIIEFFVYNNQFDQFVSVKLFCETTPSGMWIPNNQIRLFKVWTKSAMFQTAYSFFFLIFVLYYCRKFVLDYYHNYKKTKRILDFIFDLWNVFEFINLVSLLACFFMIISSWMLSMNSELNLATLSRASVFPTHLDEISSMYMNTIYLNSLSTILTFLKLLKFVRLNDRLNVITRTLESCQQNIIGILVLFFYCMFAFSLAANTLYGNAMFEFRNLSNTINALMRGLVGDNDYMTMFIENPALTALFFWSYITLGLFILLNFFIAILSEGFARVNEASVPIPLDVLILKSLKDIRRMLSISSLKARFSSMKAKKSRTELSVHMVDALDAYFKQRLAHSTEHVNEADIAIYKHLLARILPISLMNAIGGKYIEEIWSDVVEEYQMRSKLSHEKIAREQREHIRNGVSGGLTRVMEVLRKLGVSLTVLEKQADYATELLRSYAHEAEERKSSDNRSRTHSHTSRALSASSKVTSPTRKNFRDGF